MVLKSNLLSISAFVVVLLLTIILITCTSKENNSSNKGVSIQKSNGKYSLYKNGELFEVKGAGGISNFKQLSDCGGNTLRVWDATNLQAILDSAQRYGISVIVGLPFVNSDIKTFYADKKSIDEQYEAFEETVLKYKDHPALLMWCLGNELDFPHKPSYHQFYSAFNKITDMIHEKDPGHPVTTALLNFNEKYIFNLQFKCDVDIISFNIYGRLPLLRKNLEDFAWFWDGPFMVLEWGINGPWPGKSQTAWGALIEDTSTKKAELYRLRYENDMPFDNPRFLGSTVFFWGSKQETTHTWFSMLDKNGAPTEAVATMAKIWKSSKSYGAYPNLKYMLLNNKGARDNIFIDPNTKMDAQLLLNEKADSIQTIEWQIFREDWYVKNNIRLVAKTTPLTNITTSSDTALIIDFKSPPEEGPYRLFATVYNKNGTVATCNTPFYVVDTQ